MAISKSDVEILNQLIDEDLGVYRVRLGQSVHYLRIPTTVFDERTMCQPHLLIPKLPAFPRTTWTSMDISRAPDDTLEWTISSEPPPAIQHTWHSNRVDVLSLPKTKSYKSAVCEVQYHGRPAITKIACFDWDIERINNETWAYSVIAKHQQSHPNDPRVAPTFLAHLTENGRVVGLLLEKLEGSYASIKDQAECEEALRRLHDMGLIHGDVNRFNFMVDGTNGRVRMVDFEHASEFDEEQARLELSSLSSELGEDTGRGRAHVVEL